MALFVCRFSLSCQTDHLTVNVFPGAREGRAHIQVEWASDLTTLFDFQAAVRAEKSPTVILDLSQVPYIDSAGLGSVVNAHVSCARSGRRLQSWACLIGFALCSS